MTAIWRTISKLRTANGKIAIASKINTIATTRKRKAEVHRMANIPTMTYPTLWSIPAEGAMKKLRTKVIRGIWGGASKLHALEVVLDILYDPTTLDPYFAAIAHVL